MPAIKQPLKTAPNEPAEIRKLREQAEAIARDVANLHGRLDMMEVFLKFNIKSWKPTESQKEFAEKFGIKFPDAPQADDYDYAADDQNFDAAREQALKRW